MSAFVYRSGWMFIAHHERYDICAQGWTKSQALGRLQWLLKAYDSIGKEVGRDLFNDMGSSDAYVPYPCEIVQV